MQISLQVSKNLSCCCLYKFNENCTSFMVDRTVSLAFPRQGNYCQNCKHTKVISRVWKERGLLLQLFVCFWLEQKCLHKTLYSSTLINLVPYHLALYLIKGIQFIIISVVADSNEVVRCFLKNDTWSFNVWYKNFNECCDRASADKNITSAIHSDASW